MKAKKVYEKFVEDSDPIKDMGIGMDVAIEHFVKEFEKKNSIQFIIPEEAYINVCIAEDKLDFVKYLIENKKIDINYQPSISQKKYLLSKQHYLDNAPLIVAIFFNKPEIIKYLVEKGADLNMYGQTVIKDHRGGFTGHDISYLIALYYACIFTDVLTIKYLMDNGAKHEHAGVHHPKGFHDMIFWSATGKKVDNVKYFLTKAEDMNIKININQILQHAEIYGRLTVVRNTLKRAKVI